ncbi:nuclease-related domain-containing DEAD/DEAH box helicase [Demequina rhizosphaerae]|uniref:nuclease-related domain-containing DEAD/DEAH box helicase n=1 Tax=Demequina rhizosphaerae TaxID=1638985 RepID=UPI0007830E1F|nr:NERD domain-containing protein [Demequina rhizosphaerae]
MRVLPPVIGDATTSEARVHAALSQLRLAGFALHSLNLPEHATKLTAEIDFLVVYADTVLVVEVKGGSVSQQSGIWTYRSQHGTITSSEGPFRQAQSAMHALRARVRDDLDRSLEARINWATLVITPDADLPVSQEWRPESHLGHTRWAGGAGLGAALTRVADAWRGRSSCAALTEADEQKLLNFLRRDFEAVPSLGAQAGLLSAEMARLTNEQLERLDIIADSERVLCQGGAGSGKTLLGIETAKRWRMEELSVAFVCRSEILASFVRLRLAGSGASVLTIAELSDAGPFDAVVVDEGQDIMNMRSLQVLESAVRGGLDNGRWTIFYDANRQAHLYDDFEPEVLELLQGRGVVTPRLTRNCRNTRRIVEYSQFTTGADIGVATAGEGPSVVTVAPDGSEGEARLLDRWIRDLRGQQVQDRQITIVSLRGEWASSSARLTKRARAGEVVLYPSASADQWPPTGLSWVSATDVKGLENDFIAVIDVEGVDSDPNLDRLYVATTRARVGLWIALTKDQANAIVARAAALNSGGGS